MICKNCGKKIKNMSKANCDRCGYPIGVSYEGNGFFDILRKQNDGGLEDVQGDDMMNDEMAARLSGAQRETQRRLEKESAYRKITLLLIAVLFVVLAAFMLSINGKVNDLASELESKNEAEVIYNQEFDSEEKDEKKNEKTDADDESKITDDNNENDDEIKMPEETEEAQEAEEKQKGFGIPGGTEKKQPSPEQTPNG